ncbi:TRAPP subunit [Toensbergia leucococca]|nr:TRAPP subunit [Toensbergia leucococca]
MSYYFCIVGTRDNPLFELEFGTSKQGGDGQARFSPEARAMNPFIVHSSLDIVEEVQWLSPQMYLKRIDQFSTSHISTFLTPTLTKFLLLHLPHPPNTSPLPPAHNPNAFPPFLPYTSVPPTNASITGIGNTTASSSSSRASATSTNTSIANNPTSPQTEEAIRLFFGEVFECWIKAIMSPFGGTEKVIGSAVFRQRVVAAGRKYL